MTGTTKGRGFAGVIKRHHFSSNRASHGNSLSHNKPGSIGRRRIRATCFPGKRMAGQYGNVNRTVQTLKVVRVRRGARPPAGQRRGSRRRRRPYRRGGGQGAREEGGVNMDLQTHRRQRPVRGDAAGSDALFGREYNEALIHQLVTAYMANARSGNRTQKGRADINKSNKKPWAQKGTGRARAGQANSPLWRGGGKIFPNRPDENFTQKVNRKMLSRRHRRDPVAARSRGPPVGGRAVCPRCAQDQAAGAKAQGHGPGGAC